MATHTDDPRGVAFVCDRDGCEFTSYGHATAKLAKARGDEHEEEHVTGIPMREIRAFDIEHGIVVE